LGPNAHRKTREGEEFVSFRHTGLDPVSGSPGFCRGMRLVQLKDLSWLDAASGAA